MFTGMLNGVENGFEEEVCGLSNGLLHDGPYHSPKRMRSGARRAKTDAANMDLLKLLAKEGIVEAIRRENGVCKFQQKTGGNDGPDVGFLEVLAPIAIKEGIVDAMSRENKVCEFRQPSELREVFSYLPIGEEPTSDTELLAACRDVIKYSVKTTHPRFHNQLFGGMDQYAVAGAWLSEALNGSQYTYEVAPVFTLMENEVYKKMLGLAGFDGGEAIFAPGGSISNIYAINVARYYKHPEVKTKGLGILKKPLALFTSEKCHYSLQKAAAFLGLGTESIFSIKTDDIGQMMPEDLEKQINESIAQGYEPFFVCATEGTTVFGAFDPINKIADVASQYGLWLHVDGAWGGGALCSRKYRHLLAGVERADSMTWNPHKMMGTSQQCSLFLLNHKGLLKDCHCAQAKYLFQQDKNYDVSYDTGDMSIQCGRRVDVLKLWLMWKKKGDSGMERDIDHLFMVSRYLADKIKTTAGYRLILEPACTNVCFWYIPPSLRGQEETKEWWQKLDKVAPVIKRRMLECGSMMIGYNPDGNLINFFRMIISNFDTQTEDMDFLIEEIDRLGKDL